MCRRTPKLANVLYHDWEASTYDAKWSISYDERCIAYARDRFVHVAGDEGWPYGDALEIGCGTGFFLLNLAQAGVLERGSVTDISPGMVAVAEKNAAELGIPVTGRVADAETLPFDDASFDLVVGHAVLHHVPDVERALREVLRVLRPGGRFVFAVSRPGTATSSRGGCRGSPGPPPPASPTCPGCASGGRGPGRSSPPRPRPRRSRPSSTCTPSTRTRSRGPPYEPGRSTSAPSPRS